MTGNYLTDFDPWVCLESSRTNVNLLTEGHELRFTLDGLHDVFSDGKCFGKRLLDLGSGPSIHSVISASRHFDEVYLSDYVPQNLCVLADWWTGKISYMDHAIKHGLHLEHSSQTVAQRKQGMRRKIKGILKVDVRKSNPFSPNHPAPFDAIISSYCVGSASNSLENYDTATSNIPAMLTENGTFIFIEAMDKTHYIQHYPKKLSTKYTENMDWRSKCSKNSKTKTNMMALYSWQWRGRRLCDTSHMIRTALTKGPCLF